MSIETFDNRTATNPAPDPFGLGPGHPCDDPFGLGVIRKDRWLADAVTRPFPATDPFFGNDHIADTRPGPATTQSATSKKRTTLKISFLGAHPHIPGNYFDGKTFIDQGADKTFASLSYDEALDFVTRHFHDEVPPHDLRITGFSWGGWTALILAHDLGEDYHIRMGLIDPVDTARSHQHTVLRQVPGRHGFTQVPVGPDLGTRPSNVVAGAEWYETIGLGGIIGMAFAGQTISGFEQHDVTADCEAQPGPPHIYICEHYAQDAIAFAFEGTK